MLEMGDPENLRAPGSDLSEHELFGCFKSMISVLCEQVGEYHVV